MDENTEPTPLARDGRAEGEPASPPPEPLSLSLPPEGVGAAPAGPIYPTADPYWTLPAEPYAPLAYASAPRARRRRGRLAAVVGGAAVLAIGLFGAGAAWSVWSGLGTTDTAARQEAGTSGLQGSGPAAGSGAGQGSGQGSGSGQQGGGPQRGPGFGFDDDGPDSAAPGSGLVFAAVFSSCLAKN